MNIVIPKKIAAYLLFLLLFAATDVWSANVEGVRVWRAPDHTRLVFDLSGPVEHKLFTLQSPDRLVIDIANSTMRTNPAGLDFSSTPINQLRSGSRGADLRVVLDLDAKVKPRSFVLAKHGDKSDRLVVDIYDTRTSSTKKKPENLRVVESISKISSGKRDIVVAIDAGHGGEDPGALGPRKSREKDVVYKISRRLESLVNKEPGYKAVMVRTGDYYIPLKKRRNKAREVRADLFVSVHADAFHNSRARGASVFALSRRGATSETARFLASKENEADLIGGVGGVSLGDKDDILAGVLVDLSMTATMANSLDVGGRVLKNIGQVTRLHKKQVEQAGFAVLKSPDVPSILVETGFISNPEEERKLNTASHRRKLANAIFEGVTSYFYENPPEDSLVAWHKSGGRGNNRSSNNTASRPAAPKNAISGRSFIEYVIVRGDTLSRIAARHNVTVKAIVQANNLSNTRIRVGQKLIIPQVLARK